MGITVIAFVFTVIAFCLCKWGPERFGPSIFMIITGLMLAATPFGQQVAGMVVDLVNNITAGMFA